MPKIIIREFDKTTAVGTGYSNFSVLVPGFCGKEPAEGTFDENGVAEFTSVEEFEKLIGKSAAEEGIIHEAKAADGSDKRILSFSEFEELVAEGIVYVYPETTTEIGYLKDGEYIYTKVDRIEESGSVEYVPAYSASTEYAIIPDNKRGQDLEYGKHYGNQIAHELLKLGYTVLFKRLETIESLTDASFWSPLKDKALYDFRYVVSGLLSGSSDVDDNMIDLATFNNTDSEDAGRGDCTALLDIDTSTYEGKTTGEAVLNIAGLKKTASKYAAYFAPCVTYVMKEDADYGDNRTFPASFHYLACAARASEIYNEWYAIAGYTRGVSNLAIESVGCNFGDAAVNALEPRRAHDTLNVAVNLIVKIRGNYYLWGNRTAELLSGEVDGDLKASHFLNIRQLCTSIKKQVYVACRRFTFDPNSDVLWINFCNAIRPTLEKMKADQGIQDYKFVKVANNSKALLTAKIRIVPIEAVEDFDISLTLEDSVSGTDVKVDEE